MENKTRTILLRRFLAFVIDWNVAFGVPLALLWCNFGREFFLYPSLETFTSGRALLSLAWLPLYSLFKDCLFGGRSLGKCIFGLRIQKAETGERATFGSLILRNIPCIFLLEVELLLTLVNKGKRLGDLCAKTQVVDSGKNT